MKSKRADVNQTKDMKESLRIAGDIRRQLRGRLHSDSTKLVRGDRGRIREPLDQPEALRDLLSGITKENQHAEIDCGAPVGKEKC